MAAHHGDDAREVLGEPNGGVVRRRRTRYCGTPPGASGVILAPGGVVAPLGGSAGGRNETAGGMGLEIIGRTHLNDRERSDLCRSHRSEWTVEDLTTCNGDCPRGHQSCHDGCCDPAGDQEESLPQYEHHRGPGVVAFPTAC